MGENEEFVQLIMDNEAVIFKITTFYVENQDDQKDLYQDIVYQLWKSYGKFKYDSKVSTWIYRIALNTAITHLRKSKKSVKKIAIDQCVMNYTERKGVIFEEQLKSLYAHIKTLNDLEKGIILLYLENKSHAEISNITGLTITNVGTKISRIKNKLKEQVLTKVND